MATAAQVVANRSNAQKSTGPRTPEGKAKVAQNAVKHGLLARAVVLQGEDPQEFAEYREQMLEELYPDGMLAQVLAERVVSLSWRLQRAARSQNAAFEALYEKHAADPRTVGGLAEPSPGPDPDEPAGSGPTLGRMLVEDFAQAKVLERLLMYERRIESSLYRTLAELRKLRGQRGSAGGVPRTIERESVRDTHPTWRQEPVGSAPARWLGEERWEEGEKVEGSEARTGLPSSVPTFWPSAASPFPDGVTTSGTDAEGQACETKPICAGLGEDQAPSGGKTEEVGRGRPTYEEPAGGDVLPGRGTGAESREAQADSAKQSQWAADQTRANPCGGTLSASIS